MKFILTLFAIALFSIAGTQSEDVSNDDYCSNLDDGKYPNPYGCSSYIQCENKRAIVTNCDECSNRSECPEGRFHFNVKLGICDSPERANCEPAPTRPSTPPTTQTPSTPRTTTPSPTTPVTPPRSTTPRPEDHCPRNCSQKGYCIWFEDCQPDGDNSEWTWDDDSQMYWGKWKNTTCGENLFWNPTPGVAPGGHCDFFVNLPIDIQIKYKKDPLCFCPCYWEEAKTPVDRCAGKYLYWNRDDENVHDLIATEMHCPKHNNGTQLLFNLATKTCDHCSNLDNNTRKECSC